ncbi:hypothetical protein DFP93_1069 [Aneurinibacillus soli]|uniref:Uncharacterized protein n=1 Tax=Aneurinibacillus soli TaxID=1500254 RepID=A0A0U5B4M5_9BACL|nr:hypothetical protein [Aneurinibacillus soli]PYE61818.1 hypothetical protein DFP93_1069 [Aneurinibacillus soli]BAU29634.1 hypothetical protein CB4_03871 [Aneurinibacillus soli]
MFKKFAFWFVIASLVICINDYVGNDDKHLLFFSGGIEPIMFKAIYTESFRSLIFDEVTRRILPLGYVLHITLAFLYGFLLDLLIYLFRKANASLK